MNMENPLFSIVTDEERKVSCEAVIFVLKNGKEIIIPSNVIQKVQRYTWHFHIAKAKNDQVSISTRKRIDGKDYSCQIHQFLMGKLPVGFTCIDHIDRDRSNNHWTNLRFSTHSNNMRNVDRKDRKNKYRGIQHREKTGRYEVVVNKKHVATFDSEIHAAWMYNLIAKQYEGHILNDITEEPEGFEIPTKRYDDKNLPRGIHITDSGRFRVRINKKHYGTYSSREEAIRECESVRKGFSDEKTKDLKYRNSTR